MFQKPLVDSFFVGHRKLVLHEKASHRGWSCPSHCNDMNLCNTKRFGVTAYALVMTNIALENGPFIDGLPIKNGGFPWLC